MGGQVGSEWMMVSWDIFWVSFYILHRNSIQTFVACHVLFHRPELCLVWLFLKYFVSAVCALFHFDLCPVPVLSVSRFVPPPICPVHVLNIKYRW